MKPMLKEFTMLVALCANCPNSNLSHVENEVSKYMCMKHFKHILNPGLIPDWCDLPDYKEPQDG